MIKYEGLKKRLEKVVREKYDPSEGGASMARAGCRDLNHLIRLDANENLLFPKNILSDLLTEIAGKVDLRTYPRNEKNLLIEAIADLLGLSSDFIVVDNGSDALIECCVRAFLRGEEEAISISPTFTMYKVITRNHGHSYVEVPLNHDFSLNAEALLSKAGDKTVICFLNSPNNPTGNQFKREDIERVVEEFSGFVVVDEAYVDFASYSVIDLIDRYNNLIVLRTFSKAFGLAGLRVGYSIAKPEVSRVLRGVQLPYNVNKVSLLMAMRALEQRSVVEEAIRLVKSERRKLLKSLSAIPGIKAFRSDANFILFKTESHESIYYGLREKGFLLRRFKGSLGRRGFLRVTVGPPKVNMEFIDSLRGLCEGLS